MKNTVLSYFYRLSVILIFLGIALFVLPKSVSAATYYVDFTDGLDTNDGLTPETAWKNLTKATSAASSEPGDSILFQRGETWTGKITINESGTAGNITTFGAYGTGANPIIDATGQTYGVDIQGRSYIRIENMTIQNATTGQFLLLGSLSDIFINGVETSGGVYGVYILSGTNSNISLTDTTISSFSTAGIQQEAALTGLTLTNVTMSSGPIGLNIGASLNSLTISSSNLSNLTSLGVQSSTTAPITTFDISDSHFDSNTNGGLFLQGDVTGLTINDSFFNSNTTSSGIRINPATGRSAQTISINDTQANSNGGAGISFGGTGSGSGITLTNITGTSNTVGGLVFQRSWSSVTVTGSTFSTNGSDGIQFNLDNTAASMSTINISNTITNGNSGSGFQFLGTSGAGSDVNLTTVTASNNDVDGINVKGNWTDIDINGCTVETNGVDGSSGDGDGISYHNATTGTITKCFISNNIKSAIAHVGSSALDMYYNIFRHDTNGTIALAYVEGTGTYNFYNNVIYSGDQIGTGLQINSPTGPTTTIKNNIFYGFNKAIERIAGTVTEDYNLVYNTVAGWTGLSQGSNSITSNPLFRNAASNVFSLLSGSSAINTGTNVSLTTDYAGNSVPQGSAPDMGAYEFLISDVPSSLAQYESDGSTIITTGSTTDESTLILKFSMSSDNSTDSLIPQLELRPVGTAFTNVVTHTGTAVTYSGSPVTGSVNVSGLNNDQYHWQARVKNSAGESSWVSYGGNAESSADFVTNFIATTIQSNSSTTSAPSTPSCGNTRPVGQADLFQIDRTGQTAKLYFTPVNDYTSGYHVVFGYEEGDERFGGISMPVQNENQGVQSMMIDHLEAKIAYYFKVIPVNGCAPGEWSNWLKADKVTSRNSIFYRYLPEIIRKAF